MSKELRLKELPKDAEERLSREFEHFIALGYPVQIDSAGNRYIYLEDADAKAPLVSVSMTAYNHQNYIRQALESVIAQEVDFDYEVVIAEDGSADYTRQVILEFAERYPNIIKPVIYEHNVGMKQNYLNIRGLCKGKYRCSLEGDDFWLSRDRMAWQVDFLDNNPDFIAIGAKWYTLNEKDHLRSNPFAWTYTKADEYTKEEAEKWLLPAHTSTIMYRNIYRELDADFLHRFVELPIVGDRKTSMLLMMHGRFHVADRYIAARRIITSSSTSYYAAAKKKNMYYTMYDWTKQMEEFVWVEFGCKLDYTEARFDFWNRAFWHFVNLPCGMHYRTLKAILKVSDDKGRYIRSSFSMIFKWLKKVYSVKGHSKIKVTMAIFKKIFSLPKRVYRFANKNKQIDTKVKIDKFV